jgi:alcohol dehydrogenase (cytochrome c)
MPESSPIISASIARPRSRVGLRFALAGMVFIFLLGVTAVLSVHGIRWRVTIVLDKATGSLDDLSWSDLKWLLGRGSGLSPERLVETRNPFESIESPRRSQTDLDAGEHLFREHCGSCHGDGTRGGYGGPSLYDHAFKQGRSDWALFRTITRGIPATGMPGTQLPRDDVWKLVSYITQRVAARDVLASSFENRPATVVEPVSAIELRNAEDQPAEWLTYSGSYSGQRHSKLQQINTRNIGQLRVEWERQLSTDTPKIETSPIVRGSVMFVTEPPNRVLALNTASGQVLWTYTHQLPSKLRLCCGPVNRGVAVLGNRVFVGTLDAHLVALEASTGKVLWDVAVAEPSQGYSITAAPLAVDDLVLTGIAGGEFAARCFIDAYDAASGQRRWRFYTVPAAGEPGSETWADESFHRGGGPTWLSGSFDPDLRLVYWGVGNPSPNFYGEKRTGDNLYTNSVVALDLDSGKLRWYFQFTPHDLHDWDAVQIPVLVDREVAGKKRKLISWANRNGFYYVLDRTTGEFLLGTPFVKQTWADGLDAKGRPRVRPDSQPTPRGALVYPGVGGGTNWWSPAYDPDLQLLYVPTLDRPSVFYASATEPADDLGQILGGITGPVPGEGKWAVKALEPATGHVRWQYTLPSHQNSSVMTGLLSTAGQLIFAGDDESLVALSAQTGVELWRFRTGGPIVAAPVTFVSERHQFVAVAAGRSILAFALPQSASRTQGQLTTHSLHTQSSIQRTHN